MLSTSHLYKHTKRVHATSFFERGTIRLGTLHGYRPLELGPAIGDALEGKSETRHSFDDPVNVAPNENRSWVVEKFFRIPEGATSVTLQGLTLVVPEESPDYYVFCLSYRCSRKIMRAFEADTYIYIAQPEAFISALSNAVVAAGMSAGHALVAPCDYSGRSRSHLMSRIHPALLKDPSYEYQAEIRMIWQPIGAGPIEPRLIDVPELRQFCSIHSQPS